MGPPFERNRLKRAAESINDFDLGTGESATFAADRHQAMTRVYYTVVREGRFESLEDWKEWRR
jgi:branched-chain amino acid transport system substrate-binding protein